MTKKAHPRSLAQARYLVSHYNQVRAMDGSSLRLDADETNMLALALEQMRSKVYEAPMPLLKARTLLPVDTDIDPGADTFAYERNAEVGEANEITNMSDDPQSVETHADKVVNQIVEIANSFYWSLHDIERAARAGKPLSARKMTAARRSFERGLDRIAAYGSRSGKIAQGACNWTIGTDDGEVRETAVGTAADWADATRDPEGMLTDLNSLVRGQITDSGETFAGDVLMLPTIHAQAVAQTRMGDLNSQTVLAAFLEANPQIRAVEAWEKLTGVDDSGGPLTNEEMGTGDESRALLMSRTAEVGSIVIPLDFQIVPMQPHNLGFRGFTRGRIAGFCVYQPLGMRYLTGLPASVA
jgi:hypothetical protein